MILLDIIMHKVFAHYFEESRQRKQTTQTNNANKQRKQTTRKIIHNRFATTLALWPHCFAKTLGKNQRTSFGGRVQLDKIMHTILVHYFEENNANKQRKQTTRKFMHSRFATTLNYGHNFILSKQFAKNNAQV